MDARTAGLGLWDEPVTFVLPPNAATALAARVEEFIDQMADATREPRDVVAARVHAALRAELPTLAAQTQADMRREMEHEDAQERLLAPPVRLGREARRACARRGHTPKTHDGALYCADCGEQLPSDTGEDRA